MREAPIDVAIRLLDGPTRVSILTGKSVGAIAGWRKAGRVKCPRSASKMVRALAALGRTDIDYDALVNEPTSTRVVTAA